MMREKGFVFKLVESAKKWFPNEIARFNFYLEMIEEADRTDWELCQREATEADPLFEKALMKLHPELK